MRCILFSLIAVLIMGNPLSAHIFYVAADGDDMNNGEIEAPYKTISKAISVAIPSDTIYVRGGTYLLTTTISINSSKNGTDSSHYYLLAFPDERPLLDFSGQAFGGRGINLQASYWTIRGLDVKGAGDNGIYISGGSNNIIESCSFYENRDSGMQLNNGAANNRIINCDSYYNADPPDYADADGFAPKLTVGSGNYFYGCRSWGNCDDGWDGYMRGATDVTTTLEYCWTWGNGYLKDGTDPGPKANGNGFKMGGGDESNSAHLMHHFILKNCVAFDNKNKGFDQNNNDGSMTLLNCTGYNNNAANYRIKRPMNAGQTLIVKNCVSYQGSVELGDFAIQQANSWLAPFMVTADDFLNLDPAFAATPRPADGVLPDIDFLHLAAGSDLIDAGIDLGMPFNGTAPDLGAFESNQPSGVDVTEILAPTLFRLDQNYPNPFNPQTKISFSLPQASIVTLKVYDVGGREIVTLVDREKKSASIHKVLFDVANLPSGAYFYRLETENFIDTKKMLLIR